MLVLNGPLWPGTAPRGSGLPKTLTVTKEMTAYDVWNSLFSDIISVHADLGHRLTFLANALREVVLESDNVFQAVLRVQDRPLSAAQASANGADDFNQGSLSIFIACRDNGGEADRAEVQYITARVQEAMRTEG